jgi:hypothetical protein
MDYPIGFSLGLLGIQGSHALFQLGHTSAGMRLHQSAKWLYRGNGYERACPSARAARIGSARAARRLSRI